MNVPQPFGLWLAAPLFALVVLAVMDLRTRKLPNALNALLFGAGLLHAAVVGGALGALAAFVGALTGLALLAWQHSKGLMGAGDVKLLAAIGAWTGPLAVVAVLLVASVLGGVMSLVALALLARAERVKVGHNLLNLALVRGASLPAPAQLSRSRGIPFGVCLCAAAVAVLMKGALS
jgi:prepilin peptidase CpaA